MSIASSRPRRRAARRGSPPGEEGRRRPAPRRRRAWAAWLTAAGLFALVACRAPRPGDGSAASLRPTRGYVLIALDALRPDHLGAHGYTRDTSPFFDRLAAERGALFENAFAPYPSTLVSNLSLFTGLYPPQHGVYPPSGVLAPSIETLPEAFRRHGFRTAGHTEGGFMAGGYGFARGFEEFTDTPHTAETDVERTFERGVRFLDRLGEGERFFLFLHTYSTHDPYDPPAEYREAFAADAPAAADAPPPTGPTLRRFNAGEIDLDAEVLDRFEALYDGSIRYTDAVLEDFFGELDRLGLAGETTVVILADHGEEFLDHGKLGHTQVYPESLRIPLLVVHPDLQAGRRVSKITSSVDVAPTLLEIAGLSPAGPLAGESRVGEIAGTGPPAEPSGEAYGEVRDLETVRTIVAAVDGRVFQLLLSEPPADPGGTWISRAVTFDSAASRLRFEAQSFHRPRRLDLRTGGSVVGSVEITPGWRPVEIPLPADGGGVRRLTLATDGCDVPAELGVGDDQRCLSFQVRRLHLGQAELYDLTDDPGAARELARERPEVFRRLVERLGELRWEPVAEPGVGELTGEVRGTLEALGYLD